MLDRQPPSPPCALDSAQGACHDHDSRGYNLRRREERKREGGKTKRERRHHIAPNFCGSKFREIAENSMIEDFRDKNFTIARFFVITTAPWHPCRQFTLSLCPRLHVDRCWASTVHANVKRKKLDKTYTALSFYL